MIDAPTTPVTVSQREQTETTSRRRGPIYALFAANAISLIGNHLTFIVIPWFVYSTTGSAAQTGVVAAFALVPTIVAMVFGGAMADRIGHKRTSIVADLLSGVTVAMVPLLYHTVGLPFAVLLGLVFLGALFDAPGGTARQSLTPDAAALAQMPLERANGTFQVIQGFSTLVGPPLAGLLIVLLGESNVLWLDAVTFGFSALAIALLVPTAAPALPSPHSYLADVVAGLRFLFGNRLLRTIAAVATLVNLLTNPLFSVVLPILAKETYDSAAAFGIAIAGVGAGSLLGAAIYAWIGHRLPRRLTLIGGLALGSLPLGLIALTPPLWVTTLALALFGFWIAPINPLVFTLMQERVPVDLRARVFGAFIASALLAAPVGVLVVGGIVAAVGVSTVMAGITVGLLLMAGIMLLSPALREIDRPLEAVN